VPNELRIGVVQGPRATRFTGTSILRRVVPALAILSLGITAAACNSGTAASTSTTSTTATASANNLVEQGLNAQSLGQNQTAIQDYTAAIAKDPTNQYAYYDLGVIYQSEDNSTDAATEYNKALAIDASYKPALFNLAVLDTPNSPATAITLYQQLLKLNPNDPNVNFNLGLLLYSNGKVAAGRVDLSKAIKLSPALKSRLPKGVTA
jgi:Flp pilus assembly protein TadD